MLLNRVNESLTGMGSPHVAQLADGEIDLVEAAQSHILWRDKLLRHIREEELAPWLPGSAAMDDWCGLGRWLHGAGEARYGKLSVFRRLREEHSRFHHYAAEVLRKVQQGCREEAEHLLNQEFSQYQRRLLVSITELREVMRAAPAAC